MRQLRLITTIAIAVATLLVAGGALAETIRTGTYVLDSSEIVPSPQTPPVSSALVELLVNPGFEAGSLPPWTQSSSWSVVNTTPHSGSFCAFGLGNNWVRQDFAPIPTSNILSVTFWCKQPEAGTQAQAYDFFYSDNTFDESVWFPADDWQQNNITSFLRPAATLIAIRLWGYSGGGPGPDETYLDDISINVVGATPVGPSTWGEIKNHFMN